MLETGRSLFNWLTRLAGSNHMLHDYVNSIDWRKPVTVDEGDHSIKVNSGNINVNMQWDTIEDVISLFKRVEVEF